MSKNVIVQSASQMQYESSLACCAPLPVITAQMQHQKLLANTRILLRKQLQVSEL